MRQVFAQALKSASMARGYCSLRKVWVAQTMLTLPQNPYRRDDPLRLLFSAFILNSRLLLLFASLQ